MTSEITMKPKVLFVGHGGVGSNAYSLYKGFRSVVDRIVLVDTQHMDSPGRYTIRRVVKHLAPNSYGHFYGRILGIRVKREARKMNPDLLIVFKGSYLNTSTLKKIKATKIHYHPDDSSNSVNRTNIFEDAELQYDVHFTSKRHNVAEIFERTGRKAIFIWYAYDEEYHFRTKPADFCHRSFDVGFIGHFRPDRKELIFEIAQKYGKKFSLVGMNWDRIPKLHLIASVFRPAYGEMFSESVSKAPLQLGLLNSDNRDQHTARSFEISAAGGLILAENTQEHREIFGSEENALFFATKEELFQKIDWVLLNPERANRIANNGYLHITQNSNSWKDRAIEMLLALTKFGIAI